jgi:hypothetical protein
VSALKRLLRPRRALVHTNAYGDLLNPFGSPIWEPDPRGELR